MPRANEKILNVPSVVLGLVAALVLIQALSDAVSPERQLDIIQRFAFVPGRFTFAFDPDRVSAAYNAIVHSDEPGAQADRFFLGDGEPQWWTPLTYAFLHGGWAHVGLNSLWFVAFGSAVARRLGTMRFLVFCAVSAVAGAGMHFLTHMTDLQPVVGASAVVSAMMAGVVRFAFQPGAPLGVALGFADQSGADNVYRQPAMPLREIFFNRTAMSFLVFWFLANFLFGVFPSVGGMGDAAIAWEAHIGGFLVGFLAFKWFDPPPRVLLAPEPGPGSSIDQT
jgi:membrane associated rhomboid family serine protease